MNSGFNKAVISLKLLTKLEKKKKVTYFKIQFKLNHKRLQASVMCFEIYTVEQL